MCAQLRFYTNITHPEELDDNELIYRHAELLYVRELEFQNQRALLGLNGNENDNN